jgi:hypothetical protein
MKNAKLKLFLMLGVSAAIALVFNQIKAPRRVMIEWSPTPGAITYRVIYGPANAPKTTNFSKPNAVLYLSRGRTNYIRVIAILPNGKESLPSTNLIISP